LIHIRDSGPKWALLSIKDLCAGYLKKTHFLVRWTIRWILARIFGLMRKKYRKENKPPGKKIIIHSWADNRSFRVPGTYDDIFLGCLGPDLKKIHPNVCYLIDILPTCFFPFALLRLVGLEENILLMEEFITPFDILSSVFSVPAYLQVPEKIPPFMNLNVAQIVRNEIKRDRLNSRTFQTYLFYPAGKNIALIEEVQSFIYSFENQMWEKMFCLAFRDFSPKTAIIGYAHSTISKMETFYSMSAIERDFMPLPDTIVVNGMRAQEALTSSGFDPSQIVISGAFRYHAMSITQKLDRKSSEIKSIVVISPDDFNATLELLIKTIRAFGNRNDIRCIIKFHPTLPRGRISSYVSDMPENFTVSNASIDKLLQDADLVVYTGSTVAVEAMARGIPVLHVRFDLRIDRDIFNEGDHITSVSRPEEMYQAFLKLSKEDVNPEKTGEQFIREFFASAKNKDLSVFLEKSSRQSPEANR